jgi:MFS family permease
MSSATSKSGFFSRDFLLISGGFFFFMFCYSTFFYLPQYLGRLNASELEIGLAMALATGMNFILAPFTGTMIDRFGRLRFVLHGYLLMAIGSALFFFVDEFGPLVYFLRFLQGLGFALGFPASLTFVADAARPERRAQAIGIFGSGALLSYALAPIITETLRDAVGYQVVFLIAGFYAVAGIAFTIRLKEPEAAHETSKSRDVRAVFKTSGIPIILLFGTVFAQGFGTTFNFLTDYIDDLGIAQAKTFFICYSVSALGIRFLGSRLSDRIDRRLIIFANILILAGTSLALSRLTEAWQLVPIGLLFGVCQGYLYPTLSALVVDLLPGYDRGKGLALFSGSFSLGVVISGTLFGYVAELYGYRVMYITTAVLIAIISPAIWLAPLHSINNGGS